MTNNPYDATAAQVVPLAVAKLPLFHWRPASRALVVGSRDGVAFADDVPAQDGTSFRRPLTIQFLVEAARRSGVQALCVAYGCTWRYPASVALVAAAAREAGLPCIGCCNGHGDAGVGRELAAQADALLVAVSADAPEAASNAAAAVAGMPCHVEWLVGIGSDGRLPDIDWSRGSAAHLVARVPSQPIGTAGVVLPVPTYDEARQRTLCACGEVLVWRAMGRARIEGDGRACPACGRATPWAPPAA